MQTVSKQIILNVDDNDAARYTKSRILSRAGFTVSEASTGYEALEIVRTSLPDLVLLDVQLPDINGFEVCRLIKEDPATKNVLVLQTSASYIDLADKIRALEEGADNYLFEPIEPEELVVNVKALLRLARVEKELRDVNKRKDEFIAMLAHELRNPLAPIRHAVELLRLIETDQPKPQKNAVEMIGRQTDHMVRLVNDLLDVSRISQGKITLQKEPVELKSFIRQSIDSVMPAMQGRGQTLELELTEEEVWLSGDSVRLVQIISNLLNNSIKFTPPGGWIKIASRRAEQQAEICISDNGIGIPADKLGAIFGLFNQAHSLAEGGQGGLGIGLSLVRELTELHGGEVQANSKGEGQGCSFTLHFPVTSAPDLRRASTEAEPQATENGSDKKSLRVLIVDDNVDAAAVLGLMLEMEGHTIERAHTGASGLQRAIESTPDVIVLDIGLPDVNGRDVVRQLKAEPGLEKTLFIALSGFGQEKDVEESLSAGFDVHLSKPVSYGTLTETIRTLKNNGNR